MTNVATTVMLTAHTSISRWYHQAAPCSLAFGPPGGDPAGAAAACKIMGEEEESPPTAAKACFLHCRGTLSQRDAVNWA